MLRLTQHMRVLKAIPLREKQSTSYVPTALEIATHVFLRVDGVRSPLQAPYTGPFRVMKRRTKTFVIDISGRHDTVSIGRLKPAVTKCEPPGQFTLAQAAQSPASSELILEPPQLRLVRTRQLVHQILQPYPQREVAISVANYEIPSASPIS
ncbi:unnamed protein product [Fasciola hepatica]|uniref:Uncharacterized protein n=1 Tax=Fasciola hepatica TaxID=6192 RepID=A0ABC9HHF9_FASHE|nr:unnamed protein product [Fasciola hepatica]CAK6928656.1 unnamed protein product [Fasciola hepatica]